MYNGYMYMKTRIYAWQFYDVFEHDAAICIFVQVMEW